MFCQSNQVELFWPLFINGFSFPLVAAINLLPCPVLRHSIPIPGTRILGILPEGAASGWEKEERLPRWWWNPVATPALWCCSLLPKIFFFSTSGGQAATHPLILVPHCWFPPLESSEAKFWGLAQLKSPIIFKILCLLKPSPFLLYPKW